jgi:hypothetical protein
MGYLECPGCGSNSITAFGHKDHLKKCRKFLMLPVHDYIPTVCTEDIGFLYIKQLPDSQDWGIFNWQESDWIRDKAGNIMSRALKRNAEEFRRLVVAESLLTRP